MEFLILPSKTTTRVTEDNENQCQATLKRLKRGDENELERNLRLEKVVASKQLKFAMETDAERKARLEKMVATTQLRLALETEEERRAKKGIRFDIKTFFLQGMSLLAL